MALGGRPFGASGCRLPPESRGQLNIKLLIRSVRGTGGAGRSRLAAVGSPGLRHGVC